MKIDWPIELTTFRCISCGKIWAQEGVTPAKCPHCALYQINNLNADLASQAAMHTQHCLTTERRIAALKGAITKQKKKTR